MHVRFIRCISNSVISKIDPSRFIWCNSKQEVVGLMAIHVDDFLCTGDSDLRESIISKI